MTAVEWFIEQLEEKGSASENVSIRRLQISIDVSEYLDLKRKAKEMEKEQRREDLESGFDTGRLYQGREGDTTLGQLKLNILNIL